MIKSKVKRLIKLVSGRFAHLKKSVNVSKKWYGNNYGGFYICPDFLNKNSIVYSLGIGEDISFDAAIIKDHNCNVLGFDPTPKSISWVKKNKNLPTKFSFYEYGIADKSGMVDFYLPKNKEHVSGSFVIQNNVSEAQKITVEMKSWEDIVNSFGHTHVDVLKMDIEGAEYDILDSILNSNVSIKQILVEFHERMFDNGKSKTKHAIGKLNDHGYAIFGVSDTFEEVSFINTRI